MEEVLDFVVGALKSFKNDPADSDYQQGYEAAIKDVADAIMEALR